VKPETAEVDVAPVEPRDLRAPQAGVEPERVRELIVGLQRGE